MASYDRQNMLVPIICLSLERSRGGSLIINKNLISRNSLFKILILRINEKVSLFLWSLKWLPHKAISIHFLKSMTWGFSSSQMWLFRLLKTAPWWSEKNATRTSGISIQCYTTLLEKYPNLFLRKPGGFQWSAYVWDDPQLL